MEVKKYQFSFFYAQSLFNNLSNTNFRRKFFFTVQICIHTEGKLVNRQTDGLTSRSKNIV